MQIRISPNVGVAIYLQVVNQIKYLVASGRLAAGEELPPIRGLAEQLLINPNTVARAYRELEMAGIVEKRRTAGTYVSDQGSARAAEDFDGSHRPDAGRSTAVGDSSGGRRQAGSAAPRGDANHSQRGIIMHEPFPSAAPPIVEIQQVTGKFGNSKALDDLSVSVPRGLRPPCRWVCGWCSAD